MSPIRINIHPNINLAGLKPILRVVGVIIVLIFVFSLFISPQYREFSANYTSKKNIEQELTNISQDIGQIESLDKILEEVPALSISKLDKSLPRSEQLEEFLANMHKLAGQAGLIITSLYVSPQEINLGSDHPELARSQLSISLRGSYADLLNFLRFVEGHARLIDIDSVAISNTAAFSNELLSQVETLQIHLSGVVYYLGEMPDTPLFPYGPDLDLSLLSSESFKALQTLSSLPAVESIPKANPFAPVK